MSDQPWGKEYEAPQIYTTRGHFLPITKDGRLVALAADEGTRNFMIAVLNHNHRGAEIKPQSLSGATKEES